MEYKDDINTSVHIIIGNAKQYLTPDIPIDVMLTETDISLIKSDVEYQAMLLSKKYLLDEETTYNDIWSALRGFLSQFVE